MGVRLGPPDGPPGAPRAAPRAGGPRARKFPRGAGRGAPAGGAPDRGSRRGPGRVPLALGHGDGPSLIGWSGSTGPSPRLADGDVISTARWRPMRSVTRRNACCPESSGRVAFGYRKRPTSLGRVPSHWDLTVLRWGGAWGRHPGVTMWRVPVLRGDAQTHRRGGCPLGPGAASLAPSPRVLGRGPTPSPRC